MGALFFNDNYGSKTSNQTHKDEMLVRGLNMPCAKLHQWIRHLFISGLVKKTALPDSLPFSYSGSGNRLRPNQENSDQNLLKSWHTWVNANKETTRKKWNMHC